MVHGAEPAPARGRGPGGWAIWSLRPALVGWICGVVGLAVAALAVGVSGGGLSGGGLVGGGLLGGGVLFPTGSRDVVTALVLTACGAVCVEAARRVGEPAGVSKDLLSAWTLPVALLLPPVWSLLVQVPLTLLLQLRVGRSPVHRRVLSGAAIGLANWAVSTSFAASVALLGHGAPGSTTGGVTTRTALLVVALGCAAAGCALNIALVGTAARLAAPGTTWRELAGGRERRVVDVAEICLGTVIAACWLVTPALALTMLVPVLLVQRSLAHAQLRAAARTDAKTGLLNAKAWQEEADRELARARRGGREVGVLIVDVDNFKRVNDLHGHLAGDVALLAVVAAMHRELRPYDQLGRFGGEEFTVVLPGAGPQEAQRVADRLCRAVAAVPVLLGDVPVDLTVSVGVAVHGLHGSDLPDLLAAADHALYRAKHSGRNRIALAL